MGRPGVAGERREPLKVAGPALSSFVEGYAQYFARNHMAPGSGRHAAFGLPNLFMGGQGLYNLGVNQGWR